jgi:hypothetical protein
MVHSERRRGRTAAAVIGHVTADMIHVTTHTEKQNIFSDNILGRYSDPVSFDDSVLLTCTSLAEYNGTLT